MGRSSRDKGARAENDVARRFREADWPDARRHLEFQEDEAAEGRDLSGTQPYGVQVKCWRTMPPASSIEQVGASDEYPVPVAVLVQSARGQRRREVAVLWLDDFMAIVAKLKLQEERAKEA